MSITRQTFTSAAASTNGMGAALTSTGASYVLTASGAADSLAHQVTIKNNSATDHSGNTCLITGTDENGNALTETHAMPAGSATVTSVKFFQTVTSIVPSASTGASTFDIGWAAASKGAWVYFDSNINPFNVGIGCTVNSGTPNYAIEYSYDGSGWLTHGTITGKTANFDGAIATPCMAARLAFAAAGGVQASYIQAGAK